MKTEIICFTENGKKTALKIKEGLESSCTCTLWLKSKYAAPDDRFRPVEDRLPVWTKEHWAEEAIIFVGALGIAVRAIAALVASKTTDPAIVVLDERALFCIPLLSGHLGGANALALQVADITGSTPVVTTATDVNDRFAVDVFAKKNGLLIDSMTYAKEVSAALLAGQEIGFYSELPVADEKLPKGLCLVTEPGGTKKYPLGICISVHTDRQLFDKTLFLIPDTLCLGMGCKKEQKTENVLALFQELISRYHLDRRSFASLNSIDIKKDEPSLKYLAEELKVPFVTYTADELNQVQGEFTPSSFVKSITGVDNVCERSALKAAADGSLYIKKMPLNGVTAAVAAKNRRIYFE